MASKSKQALKVALIDELLQRVRADLATLERAHQAAMEGATHTEAKPENDKDTRALEQSYLARGQARRVEDLRAALAALQGMPVRVFSPEDAITLGVLVTVEEADKELKLLVAPHGGGARLLQGSVQVVTPQSPLGEALVGKRRGDCCEVLAAGKKRELEIVAVE